MSKQPLISVVVPVYNAEKYVTETVKSILGQTYRNIEIILVDDGSKDRSPELCDELSAADSRCRVIHKINGGASSARNRGMDEAKGEWICFVDSDDKLLPDSIEILFGASENADYVAGSISADNGKSSYPNISKRISLHEDAEDFLRYLTVSGSYSPYAKLFRRSITEKNGIRYNENLKCSEDALFIRQYFKFCDCIVSVADIVYYYNTENGDSLSKKVYLGFASYFEEKLRALAQLLDKIGISAERKASFLTERAVHGLRISTYHYLKGDFSEEEIKNCISDAVERFWPWIQSVDIRDEELSSWWSKHEKQLLKNDFELYISSVKKEIEIRKVIRRLKLTMKGLLRIKG